MLLVLQSVSVFPGIAGRFIKAGIPLRGYPSIVGVLTLAVLVHLLSSRGLSSNDGKRELLREGFLGSPL